MVYSRDLSAYCTAGFRCFPSTHLIPLKWIFSKADCIPHKLPNETSICLGCVEAGKCLKTYRTAALED